MSALLRCQYLLLFLCFYVVSLPLEGTADSAIQKVIAAARSQIGVTTVYDGSYASLAYPGGDVPLSRGVCTDVIVRSYRAVGVDLQKKVHEHMKKNFLSYPSKRIWGLKKPDPNIDHRRVPNLEAFFKQHKSLLPDNTAARPGDLITWTLPGNLPHIGLVSDKKTADGKHYLVIHNIGRGTLEEDVIGHYPRRHHFRYHPW